MANPQRDTTGTDTAKPEIRVVGDLMTGDLMTLRPVDSVARARQVIVDSGLHALPIIDGADAVGVVTLADCHDRDASDLVADVMMRPPVTIGIEASVQEAAELMRAEYVHHLLITDDSGGVAEVVGILSSFDLLKVITG